MKLLFVGDFNITRGTGYSTILANVCTELAQRGHTVTVLGENWDRSEHYFPFQVIPTDYTWIPVQVLRLCQALSFDHVLLAMDVPKIHQILGETARQELNWATLTSGLFPIESDPLVGIWSEALGELHQRFVISEFGQRVMKEDAGLDSVFVPMTAAMPEKAIDSTMARKQLKKHVKLGNSDNLDDGPLIVTVADNMERKDLPVIAQALLYLREQNNTRMTWALSTFIKSPHGWSLPALFERLGIKDQIVVFDGLSNDEISLLYQAADYFVISSQAEGACLPLYEAMAHDTLCIAPDHTAISEALWDGRGVLVQPDKATINPWGNVNRYHTAPVDLASALITARHPENGAMVDFIKSRPWSLAAQRIEEGLQ